jgi:hypothetical protein
MRLWSSLRRAITGRAPLSPRLAARHERREAARRRHHEIGEALWTSQDRHLGPSGERWVADVTPGTPGHFGPIRTVEDE